MSRPEPVEDTVPSLLFKHALLPGGWVDSVRVVMTGGAIASIEAGAMRRPDDADGGCALPGMANVHSHAFQRGMAGLAERRLRADDSFWSWREIMYRFLDRMTPDDVEAIAALAFMEMLQGGFTRVGEFHYLHHAPDGTAYDDPAELSSRIASAADAVGIRLTLLPCFYAHGDFGLEPPLAGQRRFLHGLDGYATLVDRCSDLVRRLDGATLGIAPHSLRAVSPPELDALVALARDRPIHVHVAEQTREVEACLGWSGQRPVAWLLDHAPVDRRWCLIHATHMDGGEVDRLAASGATVGLCPVTEASLGDGIFPATAWRGAGGRIAIGTDSNVAIGVAEELRQLEYAQRLLTRRRNVMASGSGASTGETLFAAAAEGGASALDAPAAAIRVGAPADIVALDPDAVCLAAGGPDTLLDGWLFGGDRSVVRDVWVGGRQVVAEGRHYRAAAIEAAYTRRVRRLAAL